MPTLRTLCALSLLAGATAAVAAEPPTCSSAARAPEHTDPGPRDAAQRGLGFLARSATQWTQQHRCFGCHVQAVTLEALSVGRHNHYDVEHRDVDSMVRALLLGVTAGGRKTGAAFQGSAWAKYDQWVKPDQGDRLLQYARELQRYQRADGSVADDDLRKPVVAGTMQTTFQAMQTWRQAWSRTADDAWLLPMRRAERFLSQASAGWTDGRGVYLQDLNYALLGLVAAGASESEPDAQRLVRLLLSRQREDGSWSLDGAGGDAIATGQTLYALKQAGRADDDPFVARGMRWLVAHQRGDGAWQERSAQGGADKGATMWGVLGLVTVDSISVVAKGLEDGQRLRGEKAVRVQAHDNLGRGVRQVELRVDDRVVARACGARLSHQLSGRELAPGRHLVDAVATSADGKESRARYRVYAGDVFLGDVGARFDEQKQATEITLRDLAGADEAGAVALEVFRVDEHGGPSGAALTHAEQKSAPGAMSFSWTGQDAQGKPLPRGRYLARLQFRDAAGKARQSETTLFFHDTERAQRASFAEVEGALSMRGEGAANTLVELVDARGRVVQQTRTTDGGNYRFKNVDQGKYTIRARKQGFKDLAAPVAAAPAAAPAKAEALAW